MFACLFSVQIPPDLSLADFAYTFSPLVEETKADTVVIDVEGCELLFGSPYRLVNEIAKRAKQTVAMGGLGAMVNVALAANPDAAIHAARQLKGITFVASGEELICLGSFPLEALEYSLVNLDKKQADEIFEALRLWGIRTFEELASLPVAGISERLGQDGLKLQKLASGNTTRHLRLKQTAPVFAETIELEHALTELEPLSFVLARLLNHLCASLNEHALATNELFIQMHLDNKTAHNRRLTLPYAMRDHKVFLKLLLLDTEMHPPEAAVRAVSISCEPVKPRVLQNGLFIPLAPAPDKLELTLARLGKLVGGENIGSPQLLNTHRPDAFCLKRFVLSSNDKSRRSRKTPLRQLPRRSEQCLGFRAFRPPLRAVVQAERGWPRQISAWDKQRSVYGKITNLAGPWRTTGDWWRNDCWARDEWDVALAVNGETPGKLPALYRIYRELSSGGWFIEGSYD